MNTPIVYAVNAVWEDAILHAPWPETGFELALLLDRESFVMLRKEAVAQDWSSSPDGMLRYRGMPVYVSSTFGARYRIGEDFTSTIREVVLRKV